MSVRSWIGRRSRVVFIVGAMVSSAALTACPMNPPSGCKPTRLTSASTGRAALPIAMSDDGRQVVIVDFVASDGPSEGERRLLRRGRPGDSAFDGAAVPDVDESLRFELRSSPPMESEVPEVDDEATAGLELVDHAGGSITPVDLTPLIGAGWDAPAAVGVVASGRLVVVGTVGGVAMIGLADADGSGFVDLGPGVPVDGPSAGSRLGRYPATSADDRVIAFRTETSTSAGVSGQLITADVVTGDLATVADYTAGDDDPGQWIAPLRQGSVVTGAGYGTVAGVTAANRFGSVMSVSGGVARVIDLGFAAPPLPIPLDPSAFFLDVIQVAAGGTSFLVSSWSEPPSLVDGELAGARSVRVVGSGSTRNLTSTAGALGARGDAALTTAVVWAAGGPAPDSNGDLPDVLAEACWT